MFNLKHWLNLATNPQDYIWIEAVLIKETPKAILIEFDGKKTWLPKAWIKVIARSKATKQSLKEQIPQPISIRISQYHWGNRYHQ